jgi:signal transduction histidine kinase/ActR/RegA family two-component response regulator/CHASE3 domain sensor protein
MDNKIKLKKSLWSQFRLGMAMLICMSLLGILVTYLVESKINSVYEEKIRASWQKSDLYDEIQKNVDGIMNELGGYLAFGDQTLLNQARENGVAMKELADQYSKLPLNDRDREFFNKFLKNNDYFEKEFTPLAIKLTREKKMTELAALFQQSHQFTKDFHEENIAYTKILHQEVRDLQDEFNQRQTQVQLGLTIYITLSMAIAGYSSFRMSKNIGRPLLHLAGLSRDSESDALLKLPYHEREDEVGYLTKSLQLMLGRIRQNERKMIEQNDELQAQQEELIWQQEELQHTLKRMQENERILEAQNDLNSSMIHTFDRDEMLKNIIYNFATIQDADKGAIVLLEDGYPNASVGVTKERMKQFLEHFDVGLIERLEEESKSMLRSREPAIWEQGYHDEKTTAYDLYVPILSSSSRMVAVVMLTRIGRSFGSESQMQAMAMANQVALALEKLRTYEESEHNRLLNQQVLDSIREGILLFDENAKPLQMNQTLCAWYGIDGEFEWREGMVPYYEQTLKEKVDGVQDLFRFIEQAVRGEIPKDMRMMYRLIGEQKVIQVYFEKIYDNHGICRGTVFVHRDMTREYEVDQMKSEFVSTVSHELRTPLSSVLGFTELMLNKELKPERQTKYLTTIHREAKRLTELINDFLDIQRMESGKQTYEFRGVDLLPMVHELVETFAINSPKHPLRIETELRQAVVRGDETKLRQVLLNIVGNAIKYSPDGGEVTVSLLDHGGQLEVSVSDQGLGIPKEALGKLFTKFYRIDNSDRRKIGGTGLGLAICKEIMKAHEGAILVDSVLGEGSTFRMYFPRNQIVLEGYEGGPLEAEDRLRLMIVEDDDSLALLLRDELKEMGFSVMHVRNGEEAVEEITKELPDAIVLDILLADGFNGWQVLDALKANECTAKIPIFISSALDEKERGLSLGANEYLTKPYQPSKLSNVILQTLLRKEKSGVIMIPEPGAEGGEK